jgi:hypothetical protein
VSGATISLCSAVMAGNLRNEDEGPSDAVHQVASGGYDGLMSDDALVAIDLTDDERQFMATALAEWGGPARGQTLLLGVFGLSTADELIDMAWGLGRSIERADRLSDLDWARALLLTEISWASDLLGAGLNVNTRSYDLVAVGLLRSVQYKVSSDKRRRLLEDHASRP